MPNGRRTSSLSVSCRGCTRRPTEPTLDWITARFGGDELVEAANREAFVAGYNFGETTEAVGHRYEVRPAMLPPGEYTSITGNTALAWGIVAAGQLAALPVTLGSYPITPGVRHPPRAVAPQAVRGADGPGRGRDRRRRAWHSGRRSPDTSASPPRVGPAWH